VSPEKVLFFLKPDATARRAVGATIVARVMDLDLSIATFCEFKPPRAFLAEAHYAIHAGRPFYPWLVDYVSSGPVVVAVLDGEGAVEQIRGLLGATFPEKAEPTSMRGRFGIVGGVNVAHASDSAENGAKEVSQWQPLLDGASSTPGGGHLVSPVEYVDRYAGCEQIETSEYRRLSAALAGGEMPPGAGQVAIRDLLVRESDLSEEVLSAIALAMVQNVTDR